MTEECKFARYCRYRSILSSECTDNEKGLSECGVAWNFALYNMKMNIPEVEGEHLSSFV